MKKASPNRVWVGSGHVGHYPDPLGWGKDDPKSGQSGSPKSVGGSKGGWGEWGKKEFDENVWWEKRVWIS